MSADVITQRKFRDFAVPGWQVNVIGIGSYSVFSLDDEGYYDGEVAWEVTSYAKDEDRERARTYPAQARQARHIFAYLRDWDGEEWDCPRLRLDAS